VSVPAALLGGAYVSQYVFDLYPCEMCWWQRYPHFAAIGFAALSVFVGAKQLWRKLWVVLAGLAIVLSGLIGGFHAGVEYGWWEGITACASVIEPGADPLEAILNAPLVRCDAAPWDLFGISLAGWNFLISCSAGLVTIGLALKRG
jgi:disulfide bond formation protein DsbB